MKKKSLIIVAAIVLTTAMIVGTGYGYYQLQVNPTRKAVTTLEESAKLTDVLSKDEAIEDMNYMMKTFRDFHPAWSKCGDREMTAIVDTKYQEEISAFRDNVTVLELWQAASRVIHAMHDAHTRISVNRNKEESGYSLGENWTSINGISRDELYERFLEVWPYELESYAKTRFEKYIVYEEYMNLVGIDTMNGIDVSYETDGTVSVEHMLPSAYSEEKVPFITYEIDEADNLAIFTMNSCKRNAEYTNKLSDFFHEVHSKNIKNVAIDLRENNGGSIPVIKDFLEYIDVDTYQYCNNLNTRMGLFWYKEKEFIKNHKKQEAFSGNLYVLTSAKTFSSAMDFAMVIQDNNLGKIIGEECGNMPDSYTVNQKYQMPNSKLKLSVSGAKQNRIDETKYGQTLQPDIKTNAENAVDILKGALTKRTP